MGFSPITQIYQGPAPFIFRTLTNIISNCSMYICMTSNLYGFVCKYIQYDKSFNTMGTENFSNILHNL